MGVIHFSSVQHAISLSLYQWTNTIKHMLYALSERWKQISLLNTLHIPSLP